MSTSYDPWVWSLIGASAAIIWFTALSINGRKRGEEFLRNWARNQGYVLVSARRRSFVPHWRGQSSKGYQFFRVSVRDRNGVLRRNWTQCPDLDFSDATAIEVIWDLPTTENRAA